MTRACKTCQWWFSGYENVGSCHARPPAVDQGRSLFPVTEDQDWCGSHQIRAELVGGDVRKPHPHQDGEA